MLMPHPRLRYITTKVSKLLSSSPVVSLQGPRQSGKSFLARELLKGKFPNIVYKTFDKMADQNLARSNPETFLRMSEDRAPCVIDEAQKVPEIFDAIKLLVDEKRTPGRFLLLGSTEFSHRSRIRESLTGRMGSIRLFPFTISESLHLDIEAERWTFKGYKKSRVTKNEFLRYLKRGGMPGIFSQRENEIRKQYCKDWLELTWARDIHQIPKIRGDSSIARDILFALAQVDVPDISSVARKLNTSGRKIQSQIEILESLFVIHKIEPHPIGAGKNRYYLCDTSFVESLGGTFQRQLETTLYQNFFATKEFFNTNDNRAYFYTTSRGSTIDLIYQIQNTTYAVKFHKTEGFDKRNIAVLQALRNKWEGSLELILLGSTRATIDSVEMYPWEAVV